MPITQGDRAPAFSLETDGGGKLTSDDLKGAKAVIYFYPKDNTSGCTKEAHDFRDLKTEFEAAGTRVVGVSKDSVQSHDGFKAKQDLNFTLVSDPDGTLCEAFGVWKEKSMYGKKYMGIERSTFLLDAEGTIRREWRKVKVTGHAQEVLEAARDL